MNQFLKEINVILKSKYGTVFFIIALVLGGIFLLNVVGRLVKLAIGLGILFLIFRFFVQNKK